MNYIVGNSHARWPARAGSMGRPYPGPRVAVIDDDGRVCPRGTPGDVALHRLDIHGDPDPIFFLGYWKNEAATKARFTGKPFDSWFRTGDRATMDADGYLWYRGRSDDQFKTSGYRVGPAEIEACLLRHPAVAQVAVVPKPDSERGAVVKAFVIVAAEVVPDAALVEALQELVRARLAPYEAPKEIEFVETLPMTTTGKLQRSVLRQLEIDRASGAAPAATLVATAAGIAAAGLAGKAASAKARKKAKAQQAANRLATESAADAPAAAQGSDETPSPAAEPARSAVKAQGAGKQAPAAKKVVRASASTGPASAGESPAPAGMPAKPGAKAKARPHAKAAREASARGSVSGLSSGSVSALAPAAADAGAANDEDDAIAEYALREPIPDDEDEASTIDEDE
jgi:hypothetical protein